MILIISAGNSGKIKTLVKYGKNEILYNLYHIHNHHLSDGNVPPTFRCAYFLVIRYSQVYKDGIGATCSCPVTLYFTIRDAAQDRFMLVIRDRTYEVDFNGGGTATLDLSKPLAE